ATEKEEGRELRKVGDEQSRVEHETRDLAKSVEPIASDLAKKLNPAAHFMQTAAERLRSNKPKDAPLTQELALDQLKEAREQLERMIAEAEKAKSDPLAALKDAAQEVEKILADQKQVRKDTAESKEAPSTPLTEAQRDLARRTNDVKDQPLASKPETQKALD